jgi:glycosyltransferase involved in cell wall biosynthesis
MREADGVVVAHDRFCTQLVENMRVDPAKIAVIRNWAHVQSDGTSDRSVTRGRFGWADDETVILHAGSMGVKQGLENVVRAAAIADTNNARIRFVLMGEGNQRRALEEMARQTARLEIRDPIPQSQFMNALKAADVLLVNERPGVSEMSIPSKLTSYFQSGTPVLAATGTESNTAREIRASNAGVLVDAGDPNQLLTAAESLGRRPELRETLGANGVAYAAAELSEKAAIDKFDSWIRDMVTARTAERGGNSPEDEMSGVHNQLIEG